MPASTAALIDGPSASASGTETAMPSGLEATVASMICFIATMSKVSGARYSMVTPGRSFCAWTTPFLATDQKAEAAWPWVMTTMRGLSCAWAETASPAASTAAPSTPASLFMCKRSLGCFGR